MDINQRNVFGTNNVYISQRTDRVLSDDLKSQIIVYLKKAGVTSVRINFEYDSETKEFTKSIADFLRNNNFIVYGDSDTKIASGIQRRQISIKLHPTDASFAVITIGTL